MCKQVIYDCKKTQLIYFVSYERKYEYKTDFGVVCGCRG